MKNEIIIHNETDYKSWLVSIKNQIKSAQIKASIAVNEEMLNLYWNIGKDIYEKHLDAQYGSSFAFVGSHVPFVVNGDEYECDLLFYHLKLRRYIVVELKVVKFEPEFISKLNFYCNAANHLMKSAEDKNSIGLLICK